MSGFLAKNQKFFQLAKLENMLKKQFLEKKRFHLLKGILYQFGKEQNMQVVTGRLVRELLDLYSKKLKIFYTVHKKWFPEFSNFLSNSLQPN